MRMPARSVDQLVKRGELDQRGQRRQSQLFLQTRLVGADGLVAPNQTVEDSVDAVYADAGIAGCGRPNILTTRRTTRSTPPPPAPHSGRAAIRARAADTSRKQSGSSRA